MFNTAKDIKPQGLSNEWYEGVVVANNDPRMLGRVRIKVDTIFGDIIDDHLPWAIPAPGSQGDGATASSGTFCVPKVGSKVKVRFIDKKPTHPVYAPYSIDEKTALFESQENYPNRVVHLFSNNALMIVDTSTNEIFIRNPGTLNIYVEGDLNLKVEGNVTEKVAGNKIVEIQGDYLEIVKGTKTTQTNGQATLVDGDSTSYVTGSENNVIEGSQSTVIDGARETFSASDTQVSSGNVVRVGSRIDDNPGGAPQASRADKPTIPEVDKFQPWPGVRGNMPDSDNNSTSS